jgi:pimeloyl-ACP methyl ester carboxylesterase
MPPSKPELFELLWHKYLHRPYKLHVYDHGGRGPVVVFLHGLASSSSNWDTLIPLLKDSYRCISIDLIGFGESPKPQWYQYTMEDHIRDIHSTLNGLRLRSSFMLVGHSLGSLLATRYARVYPTHVNSLVLLSPPVYAQPDTITSRSARQRTSMYLRAYRFIRSNKRITPASITKLTRLIPYLKFLVLDSSTWLPFVRSLEQCIENQTIIQDIVEVKAPIDIFYGVFDEVVIPYNVQQLAKIKDVTLHPLKVNHVVSKRYAVSVAKILTLTSAIK